MSLAFLNGIYMSGGDGVLASLIDRSAAELEVPYGVEVIGGYSIMMLNNLTKLTIPETVKKIDPYGICVNGNIENIKLPDSLEEIKSNVFYGMGKLKELKFGSGLRSIGDSNFRNNGQIESYDFSASQAVPTLGSGCFVGNNDTFKIYVPVSLYDEWVAATNWAEVADHIVGVLREEMLVPSEGLAIAYGDAWGMDAEQYTVTGRGDCTDSFVVIPEKYDDGTHGELEVKDIAQFAFSQDDTLTAIYIPKTITGIYTDPISSCPNLKKIYMTGVTALASIHFNYLTALEYVKFGSGLTDIGGGVFHGCAAGAVYDFSECESVPAFDSYYGNDYGIWEFGTEPVIKVPASLYEEWKAATNWTLYADYIVAAE